MTIGAPDEWVWLQRGNDWGSEYLAYKAHNAQGYASINRAIIAKDGDVVFIKWPDGAVTKEKIVCHTKYGTVSDHGHKYGTESVIPGVMIESHGVAVWVPLDTPGIFIRRDAFRSKEE